MVGITGRRENKLQELCSQNKNCFYTISDVTKETDTIRQLNKLVDRKGGMEILVICSGVGELNPELDYNLERPALLTNVIGFTNVADWAFYFFQRQESGHLVTISSVGGMRGEGIAPAYNASKAYQINYTEGLRKKAAKLSYPIHITDIRPGFVDTAMARRGVVLGHSTTESRTTDIPGDLSEKKSCIHLKKMEICSNAFENNACFYLL